MFTRHTIRFNLYCCKPVFWYASLCVLQIFKTIERMIRLYAGKNQASDMERVRLKEGIIKENWYEG